MIKRGAERKNRIIGLMKSCLCLFRIAHGDILRIFVVFELLTVYERLLMMMMMMNKAEKRLARNGPRR